MSDHFGTLYIKGLTLESTLHKKRKLQIWSYTGMWLVMTVDKRFPLSISSVNLTKSAKEISFLEQCCFIKHPKNRGKKALESTLFTKSTFFPWLFLFFVFLFFVFFHFGVFKILQTFYNFWCCRAWVIQKLSKKYLWYIY